MYIYCAGFEAEFFRAWKYVSLGNVRMIDDHLRREILPSENLYPSTSRLDRQVSVKDL